MTRTGVVACIVFVVAAARILIAGAEDRPLSGSFTNWIDHPAIGYRTNSAADPVAALIGPDRTLAGRAY